MVCTRLLTALFLVFACLPWSAIAQGRVDAAIGFYVQGGAYCFRVVPAGVAGASETQWTVMVLTSASNVKARFKMREVDPGRMRMSGSALKTVGEVVTAVWRTDREREEFFQKFSEGIGRGTLSARVVFAGPTNLAALKTDRERADVYLEAAKRGTTIAVENVPALSASEFMMYLDYFPD